MFIVLVIIGILVIGYVLVQMDETKATDNSNTVNQNLSNKGFSTSNTISFTRYSNRFQVRIDMKNKQIAICTILPFEKTDIIKFSDIIECQIIEDSNTIMKGGVGRAVVGGALAGGVGAIVGANTRASRNVTNSLQIRIVTKNINSSLCTIDIITREINKSSDEYKEAMNFANKVYATINSIISNSTESVNRESSNCSSIYDKNQQEVEEITKEIEVGGIYTGKVTQITPFGAFVDIGGGKEGLLHISKISKERVKKVEDVLKEGDEVTVKVYEIDLQGRINLTKKDIEESK